MIPVQAIWLATQPLDMRSGIDSALARVVAVFGAAQPHHAYVFTNRSHTRLKVLVHDGIGLWLAARRLHRGRFVCADVQAGPQVPLSHPQLEALALGLPWQRVGPGGAIRLV